MATTPLTALIVALAALLVSLLQTVQQYASSTATRAKVNRAAMGAWANRNKYGWLFWEWRLRIQYARPECSAKRYVERKGQRSEKQKAKAISTLSEYDLTWVSDVVDASRPNLGLHQCNMRLIITRRGDETQTSIPLLKLTRHQRTAVTLLETEMKKSQARVSPCKATWCNLMTDLGMDPLDLEGDEYVDADTISTALETPTMYIQMSDVISFGFLLDMELSKFSVRERVVDMIGRHCNITTHYQQGVGMLTRYSGLAPRVPNPTASSCSSKELSILLRTAHGVIQVGDSLAPIASWGFNSVNRICEEAQKLIKSKEWEEVDIRGVMQEIESDSSVRWLGKWSSLTFPVLPFVLSLCSNMAVANAFPHQYLTQWTAIRRAKAFQAASLHITRKVRFLEVPTTVLETMERDNIIISDDFKTAPNWGCEYGGLRGWLTTNFLEFTVMMSKCWPDWGKTDELPVISHLLPLLVNGELDAQWGRQFNANEGNEENRGRRMRVNSLLWLQITMMDTWIARKVETIMTGCASFDVRVPVDVKFATQAASMTGNMLHTSGWKASRISFTRHYLARLTEGIDGVVVGYMSGSYSDEKFDAAKRWDGMPVGKASDWADLDAVLTLRAITMLTRLELMKDSSALLQLKHLDPMIQIA
jgi:hypothetical protein